MGHHITGNGPAPEDFRMVSSKEEDRTVFTSSDRIAIPSAAIDQLRHCIQSGTTGKIANDQLRAAVRPICDEARRASVMPEHLLVSLKDLCHSLPEYDRMYGAMERSAFLDAVVRVAIEEYYRT
jgi:hypothetical protein